MQEAKILSAMFDSRSAYDRISAHITPKDLGPQAEIICKQLKLYYEADPQATSADYEIILERIKRSLQNPKHHEMFEELLRNRLPHIDVSSINVAKEIVDRKKYTIGLDLAKALAVNDVAAIQGAMQQYSEIASQTALEEASEEFSGMPVAELIEGKLSRKNLIRVAPKQLNDRLDGGVLRGNSIIYFARPESGKTLFAVNSIRGFLHQGLKVLYVGNEDPLAQVLIRVISSVTGMTKAQIQSDPVKAQEILDRNHYNKLFMKELTPGTIPEIRELVKELDPDVLIVDQVRNLLVKADSRVTTLEKAAAEVRQIGKEFDCVTVMLTQAGGSAEGKLYLDMNDVDNSKTGIPAAADILIGAGSDKNFEEHDMRMFTLCKNKLGQHGSFEVTLQPMVSRIV